MPADYSTGSVGIGATAPIWGAIARRYVNTLLGAGGTGRQWSLVGDAELDEGAVWEAVLDPMVAELGEVVWIVDLNRQSLDRVVPDHGRDPAAGHVRRRRLAGAHRQVRPAARGAVHPPRRRRAARPHRRDDQPRVPAAAAAHPGAAARRCCPATAPAPPSIARLIADVPDDDLVAAVRNLGGHDLDALRDAFARDRRHPPDGRPRLHAQGLRAGHRGPSAEPLGAAHRGPARRARRPRSAPTSPTRGPASRPAARPPRLLAEAAARLAPHRRPRPSRRRPCPADLGRTPHGTATTQAALGRTLLDLNRAAPEVGRRVVTVSPDVSSSTNLGGWVNKVGVWSHEARRDWFADDAETILHWREKPSGQHIELGIAETNLVGAIGELGATWSRWGQPLLPIGVLYDPFVERALEPWSFGIYAGGQSILVGTPSGVTLAPEGGAHQSITTPSIGLEQPGCVSYEPAFALDTEWCLLAALGASGQAGRQLGVPAAVDPAGRPGARRGARGSCRPRAAASAGRGRRLPAAADGVARRHPRRDGRGRARGAGRGRAAGRARLPRRRRRRDQPGPAVPLPAGPAGAGRGIAWILDSVFPAERATPMVTVLDGHPHTLAFLAGVHRVAAAHLGVRSFGQSGDLDSVYRLHGLDTDTVVGAALDLVD